MQRILDLSAEDVELHTRNAQLIIERPGDVETTVPFCDLAVMVASNPRIRISQSVLAELLCNGGTFVVCDKTCAPVGMLLPLDGHHVQAERFIAQARADAPTNKRLWQSIIKKKIIGQGLLLKKLTGEDSGLLAMARRVRSGDPDNLEAQASRRYWRQLFMDEHFRRDRDAGDQNRYLNYGYAVLRAITARALCAAGLHPSLGIHHHNRYSGFCLADDLMEPFRPMVDKAAFELFKEVGPEAPINRMAKEWLISSLITARLELDGQSRSLFDTLTRSASSLSSVYQGDGRRILLPDFVNGA